ncbi:mitochondrial inner membrane protease ATP23 homolog isoform X1 [Megachile rotundata]|uniref:mitochondrial inner membrane protease ATP23 homolog isoform X1 n=2 Tax=Megachile rotundata TaxID=143995 RepID=UPI003FD5FDEE
MTEKNDESIPTDYNNVDYSDLYPGRRNDLSDSWLKKFMRFEHYERVRCETNVYNCFKNSPIVKLMVAALKSSGCDIDISRHISCEVCSNKITGGFDPVLNQVIVCQNTANTEGRVRSTLSHELIHMFDYCRYNMDLNNIHHLACTEIRAANLCHCSYLGAVCRGTISPFDVKQAHRKCVQDKAMRSVLAVKNVSEDVARAAVMKVFDKCYNDLEPFGRRIRRNSLDMQKAYLEGQLYGYI